MKRGVKRIKPIGDNRSLEALAQSGLTMLLTARRMFREAGASSTLARVNFAISSARGAVRAAGYRERRGA